MPFAINRMCHPGWPHAACHIRDVPCGYVRKRYKCHGRMFKEATIRTLSQRFQQDNMPIHFTLTPETGALVLYVGSPTNSVLFDEESYDEVASHEQEESGLLCTGRGDVHIHGD